MAVKLLTPQQIAADWGVSPRTIRRLVKTGKLDGTKVGRVWRVVESSADAYALGQAVAHGER